MRLFILTVPFTRVIHKKHNLQPYQVSSSQTKPKFNGAEQERGIGIYYLIRSMTGCKKSNYTKDMRQQKMTGKKEEGDFTIYLYEIEPAIFYIV